MSNETAPNESAPSSNEEISSPKQPSITPRNGMNGTSNGHAALQRGMELLAETETESNLEEIKKLDSQIDHFNSYLDKFEARNNELNKKLNQLLESQKEERMKRKLSFEQKEIENKAEAEALEVQMRALMNRCHLARRVTVQDIPLSSYQPAAEAQEQSVTENDHQQQNGDVIPKNEETPST